MRDEIQLFKDQNEELKSQVEGLKVQAKVAEKFAKPELDTLKWVDDILKGGNSKDQVSFLSNAYKSYVSL